MGARKEARVGTGAMLWTAPRSGKDGQLVRVYQTAEDYRRYVVGDPERTRALSAFYHRHRRYFGNRVLDLACGGGILGSVLEPTGRRYVGIDINPDMIREARNAAAARGSPQRFLLGDAVRARIPGRFDTLTLLGNSLGHLTASEMSELLRRRAINVRKGTTFLIDYRDVVNMFWNGRWSHGPYVETHKRGKVVHRTRRVDLERGTIFIRARSASGRWSVDLTHTIWSPFILEALMGARGWRLVRRLPGLRASRPHTEVDYWEDAYRFWGA